MARYTGPKSKIARKFPRADLSVRIKRWKEKITRRVCMALLKEEVKQSEYSTQLKEKQKVKYTYGVLEKQFENLFTALLLKKVLPAKTCLNF